MSKNQANHAGDNYAQPHSVLTNDDLLIEILIRLPILCMYLFTSVSKQWRRILTSPHFTGTRSQIHNLDPHAGLFVRHNRYPFKCDFVPLDSRFESRKGNVENSFTLASTETVENVKIVQSCNGLLLCTGPGWPSCNYVYNPSTNLFKMLPPPDYSHADSPFYTSAGLRMAFDPTKSLNYKVVHFTIFEMRKGCFVWSVRYLVNTDDFMNPLPEGWLIWSIVWSIVLGEREEDSCLVINLSGKVVECNLISKTLHEIYDIGSNQLDDDELIPPFAADHNVYEFIPSFASV
ncbi:F-box protein-like protein [Tanacetum coccineum]